MARHRYGRKSRTKRRGKRHHRKSAKRIAAGRKAWRTRKRRYGTSAAKRTRRRQATARGHRARSRRHRRDIAYCSIGKCSRRPIFGGAKGLATHKRRRHSRRRR